MLALIGAVSLLLAIACAPLWAARGRNARSFSEAFLAGMTLGASERALSSIGTDPATDTKVS